MTTDALSAVRAAIEAAEATQEPAPRCEPGVADYGGHHGCGSCQACIDERDQAAEERGDLAGSW